MSISINNKNQQVKRLPAEFLVPRNEGFKGVHVALVKASVASADLQTEKGFLEALMRAVTVWITKTAEGKEAWKQACEEFNVGDLSNETGTNSSLHGYLEKEGIFDLDITIAGGGCRSWVFDKILTNALPDQDDADDE